MELQALLGHYPVTERLRSGALRSPHFDLRFADVVTPHSAFKRVVRELEFDVAELALMTFLIARAHGKSLRLLPAVLTARFQHPCLVSCAPLRPRDLVGRRVGLRSYSVTTGAWIRDILAQDYHVDLGRVHWVTFEDPHVAEFRDPPGVERAPAGKELLAMLLAGELDAAILGDVPRDGVLRPVIPDPLAAARQWHEKHGALQINHMVVVKSSLAPEAADEVYRLLRESCEAAGSPELSPFGAAENRRSLEVAIDCAYRQQLIPRRFSVEELYR